MKAATVRVLPVPPRGAISIHAAREGGDLGTKNLGVEFVISIHAAREGGDSIPDVNVNVVFISIHAAREGGDTQSFFAKLAHAYFNPRRP